MLGRLMYQKHHESLTGANSGPSRGARCHLIRLRPLGMRYFQLAFIPSEEDKVMSKQLELGTVPESAPRARQDKKTQLYNARRR